MAVETGTASGHADLLARLVNFLTTNAALVAAGQQWTVLRDASPVFGGTSGREIQLRAPGLAGTDQFFSSITSYESTTSDYYNWEMLAQVGYLSTVHRTLQPGVSSSQYIHLTNSPIQYWFIASGRRVVVVAKVSTTYQTAYLGAYLPYATPAQLPYPMMVGGSSSNSAMRWSDTTQAHRAFWDPSQYQSSIYYPDGTWLRPYNLDINGSRRQDVCMAPYEGPGYTFDGTNIYRDNVDGTFTLLPITISMRVPATNVLGELDGVMYVSGHNNASENIMQVGSDPWLVVQNIFRTGRLNYCAVRLK